MCCSVDAEIITTQLFNNSILSNFIEITMITYMWAFEIIIDIIVKCILHIIFIHNNFC